MIMRHGEMDLVHLLDPEAGVSMAMIVGGKQLDGARMMIPDG
jgi:hypothetical protein